VIDILLVLLFAVLGTLLGVRVARVRSRAWVLGYLLPFGVIALLGVARWAGPADWLALAAWFAFGRARFLAIGVAVTMLLTTPLTRLKRAREKLAVAAVTAYLIAVYALAPLSVPLLYQDDYARLRTTFDRQGVCRQTTGYTCGPAAAVSALRALGLHGNEGELALLAHTIPASGTQGDLLSDALRRRYASQGLACAYRCFDTLAELTANGVSLAEFQYSAFDGHWVAVLGVENDKVVVADPSSGLLRMPHWLFEERWAHRGIVLSRSTGG